MKSRLFTDMYVTPTDALLRKKLGNAFEYYTAILEISGGFRRQWQFSRGNGWLLKVDDTRKALYYLIAFEEGIEISLTVRDTERQFFLNKPAFERLQPQLESATKYSEGYALRFEIEGSSDCGAVSEFLLALIGLRAPARSRAQELEGAKRKAEKKEKNKKALEKIPKLRTQNQ